jgi:hypothetical protein
MAADTCRVKANPPLSWPARSLQTTPRPGLLPSDPFLQLAPLSDSHRSKIGPRRQLPPAATRSREFAQLPSLLLVARPANSSPSRCNLSRRVKKRPEVFSPTPGLAAWLLGKNSFRAQGPPTHPVTSAVVVICLRW